MIQLQTPLSEAAVRELRSGDYVGLSGTIFTARDAVHKFLACGGTPPCDLAGAVIYHCGPVIIEEDSGYRVTAAGPTTSFREEPYMPGIIEQFGIRAVVGKGGMGDGTLAACQAHGCVYMHAVGGAAQVLARCIKRVVGVHLKDVYGSPEAIWQLKVADFPALVTMDSRGNSLHRQVAANSAERLVSLLC